MDNNELDLRSYEFLKKENRLLRKQLKQIKHYAAVMRAQKSVDLTGDVMEVGKYICAYHGLQEVVKDNGENKANKKAD